MKYKIRAHFVKYLCYFNDIFECYITITKIFRHILSRLETESNIFVQNITDSKLMVILETKIIEIDLHFHSNS